jgi:hypothetical protein
MEDEFFIKDHILIRREMKQENCQRTAPLSDAHHRIVKFPLRYFPQNSKYLLIYIIQLQTTYQKLCIIKETVVFCCLMLISLG